MWNTHRGILVALATLLVLCPAVTFAQEPQGYTVTVGNEQLHFVPQPEAGYVVKLQDKPGGIGALSSLSSLDLAQATPIRGLDRKGVYVVERWQPASQNEKTIKTLAGDNIVQYVAPLFSCEGETVAVIPEIVARLKEGATQEDLAAVCESMNLRIKKRMEFTAHEYLLDVLGPDANAVFAALEQLNRIDWIEWAAPNIAFKPRLCGQVMPSDVFFHFQWHLHNTGQQNGTPGADINAPEAWEITQGNPNIVVALLDTGVDRNHPDLVNNLVPGYDFFDDDNDPSPAPINNAHGTACAGILAAQGNNGIGITGVAWNCKIMPIRTSTTDWTTADVAATAFRWAANNGADVFSCSLVMSDLPIVGSAIVDVTQPGGIGRNGKGCVVLAAAGNANARIDYPARHPDVIAVGATDNKDQRWRYSNFGPELEIVAPGGGLTESDGSWISTTDIAGSAGYSTADYCDFGGTSSACPVAAGVAALILSVNPNLTNDDVRRILQESAVDLGTPGRDDRYGYGRIDASAALITLSPDFTANGKVDFKDYSYFAQYWSISESSVDIGPRPRGDGKVDFRDVLVFAENWLKDVRLVAHWKLDETEGTVGHDSVGGRIANLINGPVWQPTGGKVDGALQFDGTDDYVNAGFVLDPVNGAFSAFAWIKGGEPGEVIISQTDGSGFGSTWLGTNPSNGKLCTTLCWFELTAELVITDDQWHHIGLVWDGSRRYLYVDGNEVAKDTVDMAVILSNGDLYLGAAKNLDPTSFFSGLIDDVRIYDRAVTP